jgi:murein DD-endopeptidase MepM/ murein hydrolase activator NlpD
MSPARERQAALAQPFPAAAAPQRTAQVIVPPKRDADTIVTGTTPKVSGWSSANAPSVTMRPGESIAILANRYGVPEKEVLRANGLKSASAAKPGQVILIPTYNGGNAAKAAAQSQRSRQGRPGSRSRRASQEQNLALIPNGSNASRDKSDGERRSGRQGAGRGRQGSEGRRRHLCRQVGRLARQDRQGHRQQRRRHQGCQQPDSRFHPHRPGTPHPERRRHCRHHEDRIDPAEGRTQGQAGRPAGVRTGRRPPRSPPPTRRRMRGESVSDAAKKQVASAAPEATGIGKYRWPVRGAVIAAYGANVNGSRNDGIDISVPQGTAIKAAENGVVIYAGNGLKELGNTVLVRHDDGTVTVYGNADTLSVTRGQKIQRGQTVAVSGMSGNVKQPQVHFEVRKDATPVNPITFLE